ncbi:MULTISPECIES: NERD domain-containing protein [Enterococcus]|uniref:NERD domain-containing protein n=1 Tax=Enterococcus TaxID=1350 RepID=UPI000CF2C463|nr:MULTISPECIES: NERD domain-containing protein [Enterococcus]EMC0696483.1 NERD domain-containing protein [Enterococcus faecalis]MDQ8609333.1 NERD domain-containing protein [Enterococcus sp. FR088]MDT2164542.1 NERD domain-containing protein [Enterococcus faecalis]NSV79915.1 NERD domain-containing protein [Enterococcus faecalis]PQF40924.1 hypothetical protein CUS75_10045 [Enterococcus faecalis]
MNDNLELVFNQYNDFFQTGYHIRSNQTALKILKTGFRDLEDLQNKVREHEIKKLKQMVKGDYQDLKSLIEFEQPKSIFLYVIYIDIVLDSIEDGFFSEIDIERSDLFQIVLSIVMYVLFLQNYKNSERALSKKAKKAVFVRENYLLGLEEIKKVCWSVESSDFKKFVDLFSFDYENREIEDLDNERLFRLDNSIFILSIEEFVEYILYQVELIYRSHSTEKEFSQYQNRKGLEFEKIVYNLSASSGLFNEIAHSVNYYPFNNKVAEIDILIRDEECLTIIECKSGTIELRNSSNDNEVKQKINNKVKKAYRTLENAYEYICSNEEYKFINDTVSFEGKSSAIEPLSLHLSMYPIDSLSSNIHVLDEKYIGTNRNPKITMSFEHFMAILLECSNTDSVSITQYLKKRKEYILEKPKVSMDINELDLYAQIANINGKSLLTESFEKSLLDSFSDDVKIVTSFKDANGDEYRPAYDMIKSLDSILLAWVFDVKFGLNKRYLSYLERYISSEN